jgi:hypothetical protein
MVLSVASVSNMFRRIAYVNLTRDPHLLIDFARGLVDTSGDGTMKKPHEESRLKESNNMFLSVAFEVSHSTASSAVLVRVLIRELC